MIDKTLVKKRFEKSLKTYNENAVVQKIMAQKLVSMLPQKNYNSIFEIGCATGLLTEQIVKNLKFSKFTCNDIVENAREYIDKIIPDNTFIAGDIEEIHLKNKYDLIISNAALQWCENSDEIIKKLKLNLNKNGILAFSIFGSENLKEIKTILNIPNTMIKNIKGKEEKIVLYFNTPIDILKHIKLTGTNAITEYKFTKTSLKQFEEKYKSLFSSEDKVFLTYNPLYFIEKC